MTDSVPNHDRLFSSSVRRKPDEPIPEVVVDRHVGTGMGHVINDVTSLTVV